MIFFLPSVTPFLTAVITSLALPTPTPTLPCSFPTTITARKLIFLPPLITFVTRSIDTTRSDHSDLGLKVFFEFIRNLNKNSVRKNILFTRFTCFTSDNFTCVCNTFPFIRFRRSYGTDFSCEFAN